MTRTLLDRATALPSRQLFWGFVGAIVVAASVTMFAEPFDTDVARYSDDPSDWSIERLRDYLTQHRVHFEESDSSSRLVRLAKRQQRQSERDHLVNTSGS
ncbi:hypothetical protein PYCC9005_000247 [Savitreella phatthalungensis]